MNHPLLPASLTAMIKKYAVHLIRQERESLNEVIKQQQGSNEKIRRAQVLLKADANGPNCREAKLAEAYGCRRRTVENMRERLVRECFVVTLNGKPRLMRHERSSWMASRKRK